MLLDITTAKVSRRRFNGDKYHVWADAHGNLQLCCNSQHEKGLVLVRKDTIDAFIASACDGTKSVRFASSVSRFDVVVELDRLSSLSPNESDFGKPYYLVGAEDFSDEEERYPELCGFE